MIERVIVNKDSVLKHIVLYSCSDITSHTDMLIKPEHSTHRPTCHRSGIILSEACFNVDAFLSGLLRIYSLFGVISNTVVILMQMHGTLHTYYMSQMCQNVSTSNT